MIDKYVQNFLKDYQKITKDEAMKRLNITEEIIDKKCGEAAACGMNMVRRKSEVVIIVADTFPGKIPIYSFWVKE